MGIGIIGTGQVGSNLGKVWAGMGHEIVFGSRDPSADRVQDLLKEIGAEARATEIAQAAREAIVVLAIPWEATREIIGSCGDLGGKLVIDCTNPFDGGPLGAVLNRPKSAAEMVAEWAPGARVVEAFNAVHALYCASPRFGDQAATLFVCGDDEDAKGTVGELGEAMGFDVIDAGELAAARLLEPLAMLWVHLASTQRVAQESAFKLLTR